MLSIRNTVMPQSPCVETRLDDICHRAIRDAEARPGRAVAYVPGRPMDAVGCWRAPLLSRALRLLLEEVFAATEHDERIELSWDVDDDRAVIRVSYPRPIGSGERLVTFFDADASAWEDRSRLVAARVAIVEHGGTLARVRTVRGTTYVASVPRCEARATALEGAVSAPQVQGAEIFELRAGPGPAISIYVRGGQHRLRRLHGLMERASELLADWCSPEESDALLQPIAAIARAEAPPQGALAFLRNRGMLLALHMSRDVPDMVAVGASLDTGPVARLPFTVWRHVRDPRQWSVADRRRSSIPKSFNSTDHAR